MGRWAESPTALTSSFTKSTFCLPDRAKEVLEGSYGQLFSGTTFMELQPEWLAATGDPKGLASSKR